MELKIAALNVERIKRQRNMFALLCSLLIVGNLLITLKIFSLEEKIIMVPGIAREMQVSGNKVSTNYVEEYTYMFLSWMLDLTPNTIAKKRDIILKYTAKSDKKYMQQMQEYFNQITIEHSKYNISTYFTPKSLEVNPGKLDAVASGMLTSAFGKKGYEERPATYYLKYEYVGGHLKLQEFYEVISVNNQDGSKTYEEK